MLRILPRVHNGLSIMDLWSYWFNTLNLDTIKAYVQANGKVYIFDTTVSLFFMICSNAGSMVQQTLNYQAEAPSRLS